MVTQHIVLDMTPGTKPIVNVSQYDTGARTLVFHLRQNRQAFTPPDGCTAILHGIKPDSTYFSYAVEIDGDTVIADCTEQMTACVGFAECEVRLSNTEGHVGSANFLLNCEKSPMTGAIISDTDIPVFEQLATRAEQAASSATASATAASASAEAAAESASAAATSETNAAASATAANTSAEEAGESATAAAESASSASGSEASARQYSAVAEQSANEAENSAQGAAQDAQTASAKASEAEASADRASGSAVDSANAANLASGYADTARTQAQAAEVSATNAAGSANTASQAAATATTKAGEASQSASAAGILADSAAASASAANTSAGNASASATAAATSAGDASDSATSAAGSASDASSSAAAALASEQAAAESARTLTIDPTLTQPGQAAEAKATGDAVAELKSAITQMDDVYVSIDGENQVTPQNIDGVEFTKTETTVYGDNIFSESYLGETGYYASINTAVTPPTIAHSTVSGYRWYAIPVDGESVYKFTQARFACLGKGNTIGSEAVGTLSAYATEINTTGASYLFLSYASSVTSIEVRRGKIEYEYSNFIMPAWMRNGLKDAKPKYATGTGNLSDGTFLALIGYKQNLRKGERYVFSGDLTTMSELHFGFTYANAFSTSTKLLNEFTIDGTYITYKNDSTSLSYINRYEHGITLSNNLQFIFEYLPEGNAKITLISNGMAFTQTLPFVKQTISQVVVLSSGSTLTDCKLTWTPIDIDKAIWMFGDSYFAYSDARWTYYLQQHGYAENALLDGFPGEGSVNARNSLMTLIQFGTPKYIVWCMGMNDGSDADASTPNSSWTVRRDEMLSICNTNDITPIFATIPNVPSINHTGKNAWIKASGYRYIDFAAAVGAESAGSTWFSGMLSSDNIHPSESGAKALFARALVDFPEIMLNN